MRSAAPHPAKVASPLLTHDLVRYEGSLHQVVTTPVLKDYLRDNPRRCEDVHRLVPESVNGIHAELRLEEGLLRVERVRLDGNDDPLTDLLLWHALFPGLRAPVVAWWFTGLLMTKPLNYRIPELPDAEPELWIGLYSLQRWTERGRVGPAINLYEERDEQEDSLLNWPIPLRALLLPLVLVAAPIAAVKVYRENRDSSEPLHWFGVLIPAGVVILCIMLFAPRAFHDRLVGLYDRIGRGYRQRMQVKDLLNEAFRNEVRRPLRR
jgi:hypothetical protein